MSGSYDRPTGRRDQSGSQTATSFDLYDTVLTGPSGPHQRYTYDPAPMAPLDDTPARKFAPARGRKTKSEPSSTPVVPPDSVTGRSLTLVVSIMCFLACLTAGAVYMINQSANAWLKDIASEVTAQIEPRDGMDVDKTVREAEAFLRNHKGIARANALSLDTSSKLLEPWLGQSDALAALPVPRLIAIEIDRNQPPNIEELRAELSKQFPSASLDDHRRWQQQIRTVTRSFALGGLAILLLVGAATTAIIVSATRSALASNREIVEVLHFVGATDRYIAREFERHFLRLGIRAGIVGALFAMAVFFAMPMVMEMLGGGETTTAEMHRLIGTGGLDMAGYLLLGGVVITISALCMLTSRFGVFRILNSKP
ncbi:MAG: ABC transporter permease [Hyphomicrobium sp.]|uniref:cell division protein FtsX n=1 Tax=Hyphomicrobium sp. TaxID=82 RepID=UPI001328351D|nr:ABC transporter permease [Hyphomicrobium sp.]KAB2939819.1 MAG: ABC transporter permease [Hyphomicrobium sp.]MBZ0208710.1 ABC transporter permease [Hyphomicrobium sp.]